MPYALVKLAAEGAYTLKSKEYIREGLVDAETENEVKSSVKELELGRHHTHCLSDSELRNISNGLVNLESLTIKTLSYVTEEGYDELFANVKQIRAIVIGENQFTTATFASLAKHCRNLQDVTIHDHYSLRSEAIEPFVTFATPLVSLTINNCYYLSAAIEALVSKCKTLQTLQYTDDLSSSAMKALCDSNVRNLITYKVCLRDDVDSSVLPEGCKLQITYLDEADSD
jgi:hypothetical protein